MGVVVSVEGGVELLQNAAAYGALPLQDTEDETTAVGEVLDARDKSYGGGERLGVDSHEHGGAHMPDLFGLTTPLTASHKKP